MARSAVFKVVLQQASDRVTTVDYATVPGTAVEGEDYTHTAGTLEFQPGETELEVRVPIRTLEEPDEEAFSLQLSNAVDLTLGRTEGSVVIPPVVQTELEGIYVNRDLGVLFYPGETHPGEGPVVSDTEWTVAPAPAVYDPSGDPYAGIIGQFHYDLGGTVLKAGEGATQTLSGWWMHYLVQDTGPGTGVAQIVFVNRAMMLGTQELDPATATEFNAWWDAKGRVKVELLDAGDVVVATVDMPYPTTDPDTPSDPATMRVGANMSVPWTLATPDAVVKFRLVPV
jgi:hypothetical protein